MKYVFIPMERHRVDGELFKDADGCVYLRPASHPAIAGKEFANEMEFRQLVSDHKVKNPTDVIGEVILLPVFTLS